LPKTNHRSTGGARGKISFIVIEGKKDIGVCVGEGLY